MQETLTKKSVLKGKIINAVRSVANGAFELSVELEFVCVCSFHLRKQVKPSAVIWPDNRGNVPS